MVGTARRLAAMALGLFVVGCGGSVVPGASVVVSPAPSGISDACAAEIEPLVSALQQLDPPLDVGLSFADYGARLGDARVAYDGVRVDRLDAECITGPGARLESALNEYVLAYTTWNECVQRTGCTTRDVEAELGVHWAAATTVIQEARRALP